MSMDNYSDAALAQLTKAQALGREYERLASNNCIGQDDVIALESIHPGVLLDSLPSGGYTVEPSEKNLTIALESILTVRGAILAAVLGGLIGFFIQFFFGGGSSGGKKGGGRPRIDIEGLKKAADDMKKANEHASAAVEKARAEIKKMDKLIDDDLTEKAKKLAMDLGKTESEAKNIAHSISSIKQYFLLDFYEKDIIHAFVKEVGSPIVTEWTPSERQKLNAVMLKLMEVGKSRFEMSLKMADHISDVVADITLVNGMRVNKPAEVYSDVKAIQSFLPDTEGKDQAEVAAAFKAKMTEITKPSGEHGKLLKFHDIETMGEQLIVIMETATAYLDDHEKLGKQAVTKLQSAQKQLEHTQVPSTQDAHQRISEARQALASEVNTLMNLEVGVAHILSFAKKWQSAQHHATNHYNAVAKFLDLLIKVHGNNIEI